MKEMSKEEIMGIIRQYEEGLKEDEFIELLNEVYGTVNVAGLEYDTGTALRILDEIAFNEGYINWADSRIRELEKELLKLEE